MTFDEIEPVRGAHACCRIRSDARKAVISIPRSVAPQGWKPGETRVSLLVGRHEDAGQIRLVPAPATAGFKVNARHSDAARVVTVPRWQDLLAHKRAILTVVSTAADSITLRLPDMAKAVDYVPVRHKGSTPSPQRATATTLPTQPIKPPGSAVMRGR